MAKRDSRDEQLGKQRHRSLLLFVGFLFLLLAGKLFFLQHIRFENYAEYAKNNQIQRERIVAPRGLIRDRNGVVLVENAPKYDIVVPWQSDEKMLRAIKNLSTFLALDSSAVIGRFQNWKRKNAGLPFPAVVDADKIAISMVRENYERFPSLRVETKGRRSYKRGQFAAHVLGYMGEASDDFLAQQKEAGYRPGDLIGKAGIEGICENYLRGVNGQRVVAVNAAGTVLGEFKNLLAPPQPGSDVVLTIDASIQGLIEKLIARWGAGAAVAMNVEDGAVIAMASLPQFDPNSFSTGINLGDWERLHSSENKPLYNRCVQATYPPGSTLKVISGYTILEKEVFGPREITVYCTGAHRFGNRNYKCWKSWGHGSMDLYRGIVESCDAYFFKAAEVIDVDDLAAACREFGLGSRTGVDLVNENQGLVPDRKFYNKRYGRGQWTQGLVLNNIIGQGEFLVSVLQMCRVSAAVANGGYLVQPHVIGEVQGEGASVYPRTRIPKLDGQTLEFLRATMRGVVEDRKGTAHATRIPGLPTAGKTGTAENPHGDDHAWYIGYAPAENPEIAVAIVVENSGHGGSVAAPIAREMYLEYFKDRLSDAVLSRRPGAGAKGASDDR